MKRQESWRGASNNNHLKNYHSQDCEEHQSRRRSSRSESGSPSGRLFSSTFSSRAKKSEASTAEESRIRRNSRDSRTPQRSRANSFSQEPVRRRSKSKTPGTAANNALNRRSVGAVITKNNDDDDGLDDVPDPFLAYKSFQQFKEAHGYTASSSADKKVSDSLASSKLSSSVSRTPGSSVFNNDSGLENFDYKFSSTKLSSGVFTSTPRYADYDTTSLNRTNSSSVFSTADSGYSGSLSKRHSGFLDSSYSASSSRTSPESLSDKYKSSSSAGKISLESLKRPTVDSWESNNSAMLRRGVSSTYIG